MLIWRITRACVGTFGFLAAVGFTVPCAWAEGPATSALWGERGESWSSKGRLPDFAYAGYHHGERPVPTRIAETSVTNFGAVGDGKTDDTAAFKNALSKAAGKVIAIPPGRYVITDILELRNSGTVLRGAGHKQTTIYVPIPLETIRSDTGATTTGTPTSNYSWSGGILWAKGRESTKVLAKTTQSAFRGEKVLHVDRPCNLKVGDAIRLALAAYDVDSLILHLYADDPGDHSNLDGKHGSPTFSATVQDIDLRQGTVTLDRPLRIDARLEWRPVLFEDASSVEEIGIENLTVEFPATDYLGHFAELGQNAIAFDGVRNSWVRNVTIKNADSGLFINGNSTTLEGILLLSDRRRHEPRNSSGHHGIILGGTDLLLTNFEFRTKFIHDITMTHGSAGNVVSNGRGEDLCFDHHKYANHANLFTNIDVGTGSNIFHSGGGDKLGRHCGAWTTWWNIRSENPISYPVEWAPEMINLVGLKGDDDSVTNPHGRWFEVIPPEQITPQDLYRAQLERRLSALPSPHE
jgi:hypothetical protein